MTMTVAYKRSLDTSPTPHQLFPPHTAVPISSIPCPATSTSYPLHTPPSQKCLRRPSAPCPGPTRTWWPSSTPLTSSSRMPRAHTDPAYRRPSGQPEESPLDPRRPILRWNGTHPSPRQSATVCADAVRPARDQGVLVGGFIANSGCGPRTEGHQEGVSQPGLNGASRSPRQPATVCADIVTTHIQGRLADEYGLVYSVKRRGRCQRSRMDIPASLPRPLWNYPDSIAIIL